MASAGCNARVAGSGIRMAAVAKPSQVWRLPTQHHPAFGALRFSRPSRPVPLLSANLGPARGLVNQVGGEHRDLDVGALGNPA